MKSNIWESVISAEDVSSSSISFEDLCACGSSVIWTESRPQNQGKYSLVFLENDDKEKSLVENISVKSRVHEYGGGSIFSDDKYIYFVDDSEKALCSLDLKNHLVESLMINPKLRVAEIVSHSTGCLYFVGEDISNPDHVVNSIYKLDLKSRKINVEVSGEDFYSSIKISICGRKISFVSWNFPNMPWQESFVWYAEIDLNGKIVDPKKISKSHNVSSFQPLWSYSGSLYYISDETGYWNVYEYKNSRSFAVCPIKADIGQPQWKLGRYFYAEAFFQNKFCLICSFTEMGVDKIGIIDPETNDMKILDLPLTSVTHLVVSKGIVYFFGASTKMPRSLMKLDLNTLKLKNLKQSYTFEFDETWISEAISIKIASEDAKNECYAFYYAPKNPKYSQKDLPPIIIRAHGGPTGHNPAIFNPEIQFWTSRGLAFLDVNYSGSSGFGREYRERLNGKWGVLDVQDCIHSVRETIKLGLACKNKIFIKGSSSGALTALMAACSSNEFTGVVSYYGVVDLELLTEDTHKFEKHYLDSLVGTYTKHKKEFLRRSPFYNLDNISCSVLLFQGKEDKVVPAVQAERIYLKLKEKGVDVHLRLFDGEGHGFRRSDTIKKTLETELDFYKKLL